MNDESLHEDTPYFVVPNDVILDVGDGWAVTHIGFPQYGSTSIASTFLLVLLSIHFAHTQSQEVCFWGRKNNSNTFLNGQFTEAGTYNSQPYYTLDLCSSTVYLWYNCTYRGLGDVIVPIDWCITEAAPGGTGFFYAFCNSSNSYLEADLEAGCGPGMWGFGSAADDTAYTAYGSCPAWDCDMVRITTVGNACDEDFSIQIAPNVWRNAAATRYWWFDTKDWLWRCTASYCYECYLCTSYATTVLGWVDNTEGSSANLNFTYPVLTPTIRAVECVDVPTPDPTQAPSRQPTSAPTYFPTDEPTAPTYEPTPAPSHNPTQVTPAPTPDPTPAPSNYPTYLPTDQPTTTPAPTPNPTPAPSSQPTSTPTNHPTYLPTDEPSSAPSHNPTQVTPAPTPDPTAAPSSQPTSAPSNHPTHLPTDGPTPAPSHNPTQVTPAPTYDPTLAPTTYFPTDQVIMIIPTPAAATTYDPTPTAMFNFTTVNINNGMYINISTVFFFVFFVLLIEFI